jgi:hypothetical protein
MGQNMIVVSFKNQTILKGKTNDFLPNKNRFHLEQMDGSITDIVVDDLKAIFFVRDFEGNKDRKDSYNDIISNAGRKTTVEFLDGETISGYTLGYSPERQGFYLTPADLAGNNERIFVVLSATKSVQFV